MAKDTESLVSKFHDQIINEVCDRLAEVLQGRVAINSHNCIRHPEHEDVLQSHARMQAYQNAVADIERIRKEFLVLGPRTVVG